MSRKTRRHPNAATPPPPVRLTRVEAGHYQTEDGKVRVENANDGKREACWNAYDIATGKLLVGAAPTLAAARRRLANLARMMDRARAMAGAS